VLARSARVPRPGALRARKEEKAASRVTISLPPDIAEYLRMRAGELNAPVSGFVAETIQMRRDMELDTAIVEGLLEDAERDRELVEEWSGTLPPIPD
jgi:hypothetical protein